MLTSRVTKLLPVLCLLLLSLVDQSASRKQSKRNYVLTRVLDDGEVETVVRYRGVTARELTAGTADNGTSSSVDGQHPSDGFILWQNGKPLMDGLLMMGGNQVTDGRHFLQLIFNSQMKLWDCDFVTDSEAVSNFIQDTKSRSKKNRITLKRLDARLKKLTSYRTLKKQCKQLHKVLKRQLKYKSKTKDHSLQRMKRGVFIYPGTNFCGVGSSDIDRAASRSDRCCRDHDHCPYMVEGWSTKYNLFNYRFHTLSHCHCDERFRACLKQINSSTSNMLGYIYFNVVKMKCFTFKKEKVCAKRSWWGSCAKYENSISAHLRDPTAY